MKILVLSICTFFIACGINEPDTTDKADQSVLPKDLTDLTPLETFSNAYKQKQSNIQVEQKGVITAVLADDNDGSRHQRLIVRLANNQTLLIAHNIDIAKRVPNPVKGTSLHFYGEYEWNDEGGVVHWTHKDPAGRHIDGWLEYDGRRYQ